MIPEYIQPRAHNEYADIWKIMRDKVLSMKAKTILETGTRDGNSLRIFAEALFETGGHITTVDRFPTNWTNEHLIRYPNVTYLIQDTLLMKWNQPIDILYLDSDHRYDHVKEELKKFGKLAKVILLHDVNHHSDGKGIRQAMHEYCIKNKFAYTIYPGECGLGEITVKEIEK